ncbi:hypothetical protein HDU96_001838 [Phlyctochytrium bullatum]|nr:hypothetical protein HDU96_001838 [Phlyctochytrium bullatum]
MLGPGERPERPVEDTVAAVAGNAPRKLNTAKEVLDGLLSPSSPQRNSKAAAATTDQDEAASEYETDEEGRKQDEQRREKSSEASNDHVRKTPVGDHDDDDDDHTAGPAGGEDDNNPHDDDHRSRTPSQEPAEVELKIDDYECPFDQYLRVIRSCWPDDPRPTFGDLTTADIIVAVVKSPAGAAPEDEGKFRGGETDGRAIPHTAVSVHSTDDEWTRVSEGMARATSLDPDVAGDAVPPPGLVGVYAVHSSVMALTSLRFRRWIKRGVGWTDAFGGLGRRYAAWVARLEESVVALQRGAVSEVGGKGARRKPLRTVVVAPPGPETFATVLQLLYEVWRSAPFELIGEGVTKAFAMHYKNARYLKSRIFEEFLYTKFRADPLHITVEPSFNMDTLPLEGLDRLLRKAALDCQAHRRSVLIHWWKNSRAVESTRNGADTLRALRFAQAKMGKGDWTREDVEDIREAFRALPDALDAFADLSGWHVMSLVVDKPAPGSPGSPTPKLAPASLKPSVSPPKPAAAAAVSPPKQSTGSVVATAKAAGGEHARPPATTRRQGPSPGFSFAELRFGHGPGLSPKKGDAANLAAAVAVPPGANGMGPLGAANPAMLALAPNTNMFGHLAPYTFGMQPPGQPQAGMGLGGGGGQPVPGPPVFTFGNPNAQLTTKLGFPVGTNPFGKGPTPPPAPSTVVGAPGSAAPVGTSTFGFRGAAAFPAGTNAFGMGPTPPPAPSTVAGVPGSAAPVGTSTFGFGGGLAFPAGTSAFGKEPTPPPAPSTVAGASGTAAPAGGGSGLTIGSTAFCHGSSQPSAPSTAFGSVLAQPPGPLTAAAPISTTTTTTNTTTTAVATGLVFGSTQPPATGTAVPPPPVFSFRPAFPTTYTQPSIPRSSVLAGMPANYLAEKSVAMPTGRFSTAVPMVPPVLMQPPETTAAAGAPDAAKSAATTSAEGTSTATATASLTTLPGGDTLRPAAFPPRISFGQALVPGTSATPEASATSGMPSLLPGSSGRTTTVAEPKAAAAETTRPPPAPSMAYGEGSLFTPPVPTLTPLGSSTAGAAPGASTWTGSFRFGAAGGAGAQPGVQGAAAGAAGVQKPAAGGGAATPSPDPPVFTGGRTLGSLRTHVAEATAAVARATAATTAAAEATAALVTAAERVGVRAGTSGTSGTGTVVGAGTARVTPVPTASAKPPPVPQSQPEKK